MIGFVQMEQGVKTMADRLLVLQLNTLLDEEHEKELRQRICNLDNMEIVVLNPYVTPLIYADDNTTIDFTRGDNNG